MHGVFWKKGTYLVIFKNLQVNIFWYTGEFISDKKISVGFNSANFTWQFQWKKNFAINFFYYVGKAIIKCSLD
jgi:hypothetical protein